MPKGGHAGQTRKSEKKGGGRKSSWPSTGLVPGKRNPGRGRDEGEGSAHSWGEGTGSIVYGRIERRDQRTKM